MNSFGKYAILDAPEYCFKETPDLYWKFKPASSADELAMSRFYDSRTRTINDVNGKPLLTGPYWIEVMWREIALLFAGTNIKNEAGKPALSDRATVEEVENLLHDMPQGMVEELWRGLGEAVPGWGPRKPQPEEEAGETSSQS